MSYLSKSLFQSSRPKKQSVRRSRVIREDDDMVEEKDDHLGKLLLKLHMLKRGPERARVGVKSIWPPLPCPIVH